MPPRKRNLTPVPPPRDTDEELDARLEENVPDTFEPGYEAHQLRIKGVPWREVAEKIGSPNAVAAQQIVTKYLQQAAAAQSAQQKQEALQTQLDRYEHMVRQWWPAGVDGRDEKAAMVLLKVLERIDKLQRLDEGDAIVTRETIVVAADPESYVRQLQDVVAQRSPTPADNSQHNRS